MQSLVAWTIHRCPCGLVRKRHATCREEWAGECQLNMLDCFGFLSFPYWLMLFTVSLLVCKWSHDMCLCTIIFGILYSGDVCRKYQKHTRKGSHALLEWWFLKLKQYLYLPRLMARLMFGKWFFQMLLEVSDMVSSSTLQIYGYYCCKLELILFPRDLYSLLACK